MADKQKERLLQALDLVRAAMTSPNTFENSKETTFSALRRGCLDLRKDTDQLDSDDFSTDRIRDAWLFLMELSKAKLRRKHALECINIMLVSPKWGAVLRNDPDIQSRLSTLSTDMQVALGHKPKVSDSPVLKPSTATIPSNALTRKASQIISPVPTVLSRAKSVTKQQIKRSASKQENNSASSSRRGSQEMQPPFPPNVASIPVETDPSTSAKPTLSAIPISEPGRRPPDIPIEASCENQLNPFRCDFNPFKEFRGQAQRRQAPTPQSKNPIWWEECSSRPVLPDPWW